MSPNALVTCHRQDSIVTVTMANGQRRNALSLEMMAALSQALSQASSSSARVVILRASAESSVWCSGYDIHDLPTDGSAPDIANPLDDLFAQIRGAAYPVIAAINGGAWGGGFNLALACDLIVATREATFAITPAKLGVGYATSGIAAFISALPINIARQLLFTAEPMSAVALAELGVVNAIVETPAQLTLQAESLAMLISQRAPLTIASVKAQITALSDPRLDAHVTERIDQLRATAWASADFQEGIAAVRNKRPPHFSGQ